MSRTLDAARPRGADPRVVTAGAVAADVGAAELPPADRGDAVPHAVLTPGVGEGKAGEPRLCRPVPRRRAHRRVARAGRRDARDGHAPRGGRRRHRGLCDGTARRGSGRRGAIRT